MELARHQNIEVFRIGGKDERKAIDDRVGLGIRALSRPRIWDRRPTNDNFEIEVKLVVVGESQEKSRRWRR
jgi:hypothetical protein